MRGVFLILLLVSPAFGADTPAGLRFFEARVRPVLVKHCYSCHSAEAKKSRGGLRVDTREALLKGGDVGPAVVPGKPLASLLIRAVRHDGIAMPPKERLAASVVADLEAWVKMGAPDPRTGKVVASASGIDIARGKQFWSFRPIQRVPTPQTRGDWASGDIDAFLLKALQSKGLTPVADALPAKWLRRVTFDLIGLPPTPGEIDDFLADSRPDARERVVDRLLASPAFGERWGRHWLDVARYADSNGKDENLTFHQAHLYRDWVIRNFNADRPYDAFIREQIAGDLLGASEDQLAASGFLVIGPKVLADRDQERRRLDVIDEQIDTIGRTILGLTLGCARCHDHKFDPIPTADYYALAGIFSSTRTLDGFKLGNPIVAGWSLRPLNADSARQLAAKTAYDAELKALRGRLTKARASLKNAENMANGRVPSRLAGIVVDDKEARLVGKWKASTFTRPYIGAGYIHDDRAGKGEKSALFVPKLPKAGDYEVQVAYTPGTSRATNVPVTIRHAGGEKTVRLDQRKRPPLDGLFVSVGVFAFKADGARVSISNKGTEGHVIVDAVRFVPRGEAVKKIAARETGMGVSPRVKEAIAAARKRVAVLEAQEKKLKESAPPAPRLVMAPRDEATPADMRIHIRGTHEALGASVPRGTLRVASWSDKFSISSGQSGRAELARWLTDERNPLTARVFVNRVWHHLFGAGLVRSVDDFGSQGERPSHPALLDALASDFMADGWRIKPLVRRLVLTRAYGLAVGKDSKAFQADPENRLLWRGNRRRLEAEAIRDSILAVAGTLDRRMGGSSVAMLPERAVDNNSKGGIDTSKEARRSVYLPVLRNGLPPLFEVFDFADPDVATGKRDATTVPTQALFLLNSPFVLTQSRQAADRLMQETGDEARVRLLYRRALGRTPEARETGQALAFLKGWRKEGGEREAWAALCQAVMGCTEFRFVE